MSRYVSLLIFFILFYPGCHTNRVAINIPVETLSEVRAIIFLPIKENFELKEMYRYSLLTEAADEIAKNGNFFVLLPYDYRLHSHCKHKEIFICSNLREILSEAGIRADMTLFVEYSMIRETGFVDGELTGRRTGISEKSLSSEMNYWFITKLYHYKFDDPIFEDRHLFKSDLSSIDFFKKMSEYNRSLLKSLVRDISKVSKGSSYPDYDIRYYKNHFQAVYSSEEVEIKDCHINHSDVEKEIEAGIVFEYFYRDECNRYLGIMKNYSCGLLVSEGEIATSSGSIGKGDLILSFCGFKVNGYYSIKNALISGRCEKNRDIIVIRDSKMINFTY